MIGEKKYPFIASVIGAALVFIATSKYGIGIFTDSVAYIATARHILSGNGVTGHLGNPLVDYPPFYSIVIAILSFITNTDPIIAARYINIFSFAVTIYFTWLLAEKYFKKIPVLVLLTAAAVLFSLQLFLLTIVALSESLFVMFSVIAFYLAEKYMVENKISLLLLFSIVVALSTMTRYIGITLVLLGMALIIFFRSGELKNKILHSGIFLFISTTSLFLWIARNYSLTGTFFGKRYSTIFSFTENLQFTSDTIIKWFIHPKLLKYDILLILLAIVIVSLLWLSVRNNYDKAKNVFIEGRMFFLFIVIYLAFLIISASRTAYDKIDDRLLIPIFIPVVFVVFLIASELVSFIKNKYSAKAYSVTLIVIICMWLIYPVESLFAGMHNMIVNGVGLYTTTYWKESPTMNYLRMNKIEDAPVYTNSSDALYILTGIEAKWTPDRYKYNSTDTLITSRGSWPPEDKAYLVWSFKAKWKNQLSLNELKSIVNMKEIKRFDDGVIYLLSKDNTMSSSVMRTSKN